MVFSMCLPLSYSFTEQIRRCFFVHPYALGCNRPDFSLVQGFGIVRALYRGLGHMGWRTGWYPFEEMAYPHPGLGCHS